MSNAERIEQALSKAGMGGIFLVKTNAKYSNLVDITHNKERASKNHVEEDLHRAIGVLDEAGFEAWKNGWTLCARKPAKRRADDYERHEGQYAGAYDIELTDLC